MILKVSPAVSLQGEAFLPASKSYSIRAFIIAACGGRSRISNPSGCDDAKVAARVGRALGAKIISKKNIWRIAAAKSHPVRRINVGESGTVLRFVLPLLALRGQAVTVDGQGTLRGRPNKHLIELLRSQGVRVSGKGVNHSVPVKIVGGRLRGGKMIIDGSLSSQFISGLLITCPQIAADTRLVISGKRLVSADYIAMTVQVLKQSGVRIIRKNQREFFIPGGQTFRGLRDFVAPSDSGLAAFLIAAGVLLPSDIRLKGCLRPDLVQADSRIFSLLRKMGARLKKTKTGVRIRGPFVLRGGNFSLESAPDLVPIVAVLALFARGRTRIYNIAHAKAKESDRIGDLRQELMKIGARVDARANEIIVYPQKKYRNNVVLDPRHDHRLAMAFSVLGLKIGVSVKDIECTAKSYPEFVRDFRKIGARAVVTH